MAAAGLKIAFMESVNFLWKSARAAISAIGQYFIEVFRTATTVFDILTTADFWKGMGNAIVGIFLSAVALLQEGLAKALEIARPLADLFGKGETIDAGQTALRASASGLQAKANERFGTAGDQLGPMGDQLSSRLETAGANISAAFSDTFARAGDVLDASGAKDELAAAFAKVSGQIAANATAAAANQAAQDAALPKPAPATAPPPAQAAARQVQADRLRQIGGYVGRGLEAGRDRLAERTEQWTRKSAEALAKLVTAATAPKPAGAAPGTFV
jgi:hypothetical protein